MAKLVYVCFRNREAKNLSLADMEILGRRLCPDNITPNPALIREGACELIAVYNPNPAVLVRDYSVCLGNLISDAEEWWKPGTAIPDGSFVLTRVNTENVECITDAVGSRALWYVHTDKVFMASTSQRALVYCLRSFELNRVAVSWLLSGGHLGPGEPWDPRIKFMGGHAKVALNRATWKTTFTQSTLEFTPMRASRKEHMKRLRNVIETSVKAVNLDLTKWLLPLSGGRDSRAIFLATHDKTNLRTITWGTRAAVNDEGSDAHVAKQLAKAFDVPHTYMALDIENPESVEVMLHRYLSQSEARLDRFEGYTDGFKIWKSIFESGVYGIIRGDRPYGGRYAFDAVEVREGVSLMKLDDYSNIPAEVVNSLAKQTIPEFYQRRENETLAAWRDRLDLDFAFATNLSANADCKFGYVEIVNPLVSRKMVDVERTMPDAYRTERWLYKKTVKSMSPPIPFAHRAAIASHKNLVRSAPFVKLIRAELQSAHAEAIFGKPFLEWILPQIKPVEGEDGVVALTLEAHIRKAMPSWLKRLVRRVVGHKVSQRPMQPNLLAFRAFMASRMVRLLQDDAGVLSGRP